MTIDLGFFKLPLDAEIQKVVKGPKLNTMLAYFNQVSFLFMLAASGCYALVSWAFGPKAFLLLFAVVMLVVPFLFVFSYRSVLLCTGRWIFAQRGVLPSSVARTLRLPQCALCPGTHGTSLF